MTALLTPVYMAVMVRTFCRGLSTSLTTVAHQIQHNSSKILVMAGAGLSTPSGIPDFRSPDSGLYSQLEKYKLPYPEAIFDMHFFTQNPAPFLDLARRIYPGAGNIKPNLGHYFVRLLEKKGKLLRMYTQNIDGLERLSGLCESRLVEAHGGFATASCVKCGEKQNTSVVKNCIMEGKEPRCDQCKGLVKPDITFFGEMLPERFMHLSEDDTATADLLIVIGTSLVVHPFAGLADMVRDDIPRVLINRDVVGNFGFRPNDSLLLGDIIEQIRTLAYELGWLQELNSLMSHSSTRKG